MITAKVVNLFKALEHNGHIYKAGDTYPADGFTAAEERVYFLTGVHPKYKKIYLAEVTVNEQEEPREQVSEFPKHTGKGYYELSNGTKVKGKEEAIEAENALKSGV
ncbi:hypothetical protein B1B04_18895 [Lysinibacillus sp. KCTC 33748]|uniref:hypothetical protein n=1 Tax=unclassified Lysinibacillus TaxID=2636778 RepID=UPI0009A55E39|nr:MULTISPECIES: hypothetical protein [unclassified Lysinibacillus]OXS70230.1 hypothetical protein B1B04_18895 [Lysinibacillus sp. KCTC 33748]SKC04952.1 hypothetical protein SAMN06295926_11968 [Lysinibacillus sp. AC-3]